MSKPTAGKPPTNVNQPTPGSATTPVRLPDPPRPLRKLLLVLGVAYFLWLATLLVMYFTTVYPQRHSANPGATQPA